MNFEKILVKINGSTTNYAAYNVNAIILSLIIVSVPILIALIIPLVKPKMSKSGNLYLYSFTTGFFLVLGLFGEAREGVESVQSNFDALAHNNALHDLHPPGGMEAHAHIANILQHGAVGSNLTDLTTVHQFELKAEWLEYYETQIVGFSILILVVGAIIGLGFSYLFKMFINKRLGQFNLKGAVENHADHDAFHNHVHVEDVFLGRAATDEKQIKNNLKTKAVAIYLILSHRVAAGFFLGFILYNMANGNGGLGVAFLIAFFLHLIPEEMIIYYRQREMKISRWKSTLFSVLMVCLLIPFIFLGVNLGAWIDQVWWLQGIIHVVVGMLFVFTAIVEFMPEIIAEAKNQKFWYLAILAMIIGVIVSFIVLSIH